MTTTIEAIIHWADERRMAMGDRLRVLTEVRDTYGGDVVVPLPELDAREVAAIANQLQTGLDGTSQRAASTQPDAVYPSERSGYKGHDDKARDRRHAALEWWKRNEMEVIDARRYRHLFGYASSPVMLKPNTRWGHAEWQVRDPLESFPSPSARFDDMTPSDVIWCYRRSLKWVRDTYPERVAFLTPKVASQRDRGEGDEMVEIIEFVDDKEIVLIARGRSGGQPMKVEADYGRSVIHHLGPGGRGYEWGTELERYDNRAGRCTAVVPGRITLAGPVGQFDALPGMHWKQAKLDALEYRAIEEGVFPKLWLVSHPNAREDAEIIVKADGRRGIVGEIRNGTLVNVNPQPSYLAYQAQDRLEREQRNAGRVPAQMSGENPTNVRTGRASDLVLSAAIDHGIAEAQRVMARSKQHELEIAAAISKGWFGPRSVSFYVNWKGAKGAVTYTGTELFDDPPPPVVAYAMAGADSERLTVQLQSRVGSGMVSKDTARRKDPFIDDAEHESDMIVFEGLQTALLTGIQERAASDPSFTEAVARMMAAVRVDKTELQDAYLAEQRRVQEQQATSGPPGTPAGPADPNAPEAQPGLGVEGGGAVVGAAVPEVGPSMDHFDELLNKLQNVRTSSNAAARGL